MITSGRGMKGTLMTRLALSMALLLLVGLVSSCVPTPWDIPHRVFRFRVPRVSAGGGGAGGVFHADYHRRCQARQEPRRHRVAQYLSGLDIRGVGSSADLVGCRRTEQVVNPRQLSLKRG